MRSSHNTPVVAPTPPTSPAISQRRRPGDGSRMGGGSSAGPLPESGAVATWAAAVSASNIDGVCSDSAARSTDEAVCPFCPMGGGIVSTPTEASNTMSSLVLGHLFGDVEHLRGALADGGDLVLLAQRHQPAAQLGLAGRLVDAALGGLQVQQHLLAGLVAIGRAPSSSPAR